MLDPEPIEVPPEVVALELRHHLPALFGTVRQIKWARLIRYQLLSKSLPKFKQFMIGRSADDVIKTKASVEWLCQHSDAVKWITLREYWGRPTDLLATIKAEMDLHLQIMEEGKSVAAAILGPAIPNL